MRRPVNSIMFILNLNHVQKLASSFTPSSFISTAHSQQRIICNNIPLRKPCSTASVAATTEKEETATSVYTTKPYFPIYYNDVYEVPLPPNHRFPMDKYRLVRKRLQAKINELPLDIRNTIQYDFRISPLVSVEDLTTTHCPDYVKRFMIGDQTDDEIRNVGFPWSTHGVDRALSSTGGTVAAAVSICEAKIQQQKASHGITKNNGFLWSAHVAGGTHHAFKDRGEGFCIFSDIAVASNVILRDFPDIIKRILIIDLDVHQGNGNAVLFKSVNEVTTFSIHCKANYFSEKQKSDLDIELPQGCGDETYLPTLNYWLNRVKRGDAGNIDFIFFQAGVDILNDDRLGKLSLTQDGINRRNKMVFDLANELNCPLCITMGGGYPKKDWEPILEAHVNVYFQAFQYLMNDST